MFRSQAQQDVFLYAVLADGGVTPSHQGSFVEIGAGNPVHWSNSFIADRALHWRGVSIEIDETAAAGWDQVRTTPVLIGDALAIDYADMFAHFKLPKVIDYLSLDIDDAYDTVLARLPLDAYTFRVITIEHDAYRYGPKFRDAERAILQARGYILVCPDMTFDVTEQSFEDWYVHPDHVPVAAYAKFLNRPVIEMKQYLSLLATKFTNELQSPTEMGRVFLQKTQPTTAQAPNFYGLPASPGVLPPTL